MIMKRERLESHNRRSRYLWDALRCKDLLALQILLQSIDHLYEEGSKLWWRNELRHDDDDFAANG